LFALLTICAAGFAWWATWRRAIQKEKTVVDAIHWRGQGYVFFAEHWDSSADDPILFNAQPQRTWRDYLLGRDALDRVVAISFDSNFHRDYAADPFTAPTFFQLAHVPEESLRTLAMLPNLRWLDFESTSVTDEQLLGLPVLSSVETLRLSRCRRLTARGLKCLDRFPNLRCLDLSGTNFTWPRGLGWTTEPELQSLDLSEASLTDADIAAISALAALENLELDRTRITNQGLPHLYKLTKLRRLNLEETQVTRIGVYRLRMQLPALEVITPFDEEE
jgi:hypothetical protein